MTYQFPDSLAALRKYLASRGLSGDSIKTSRQCAFMAQQLLGLRMRFPPQGSDMLPTLLAIQKQLPGVMPKSTESGRKPVESPRKEVIAGTDLFGATPSKNAKGKKGKKSPHKPEKPTYLRAFSPEAVSTGYHLFADGASVPNPGLGGWGIVAYRDGEEIYSECGGEEVATNNSMELTAILRAVEWASQYPDIPITIWSDSEYSVKGVNDWRHGWKRNGWQRGGANADPKNRILVNADLWQSIDAALSSRRAENISVFWIKGHAGHLGNERADELAELGRASLQHVDWANDDLDAQYRSIMAG